MSLKLKSHLLVLAQFTTFILIILSGPIIAQTPLLFLIQLLAVGLGAWSIYTMSRLSTFKVAPTPHLQAKLVIIGPYRYIRHPMYTAVIFGFGAMVFYEPTPLRIFLWLLLVLVHLTKLRFEEKLLLSRFPDYRQYQKETYRLIPHIY